MNKQDIKKYVLLKDGTIKIAYFNLHSKHKQLRDFENRDDGLYMHYTLMDCCYVDCCQKVIATSNKREDLLNYARKD